MADNGPKYSINDAPWKGLGTRIPLAYVASQKAAKIAQITADANNLATLGGAGVNLDVLQNPKADEAAYSEAYGKAITAASTQDNLQRTERLIYQSTLFPQMGFKPGDTWLWDPAILDVKDPGEDGSAEEKQLYKLRERFVKEQGGEDEARITLLGRRKFIRDSSGYNEEQIRSQIRADPLDAAQAFGQVINSSAGHVLSALQDDVNDTIRADLKSYTAAGAYAPNDIVQRVIQDRSLQGSELERKIRSEFSAS